ncbi:BsaA family SipW-dependent biofilm matrix protein [uncultured Ruminococcus sp.]|uniref:BsaA family SipW-dependent biofilm matrix protein n=1 Tax=uncultured Ruminococcus sp. TaxID=165186 RepID=UPI0025FC9310|nr:BsaA family SipW-dependent biofilm matrix protein [uncultured Ruminococcus sp.]
MTNTKKKKSARDKRVLIASIICAGLIVAGSTFAWFTSKDEVTNRLSASANYNVTIAEDFQPPEEWIPGQTINKDVSAVNTGNVDAFVRMWLEGEMSVVKKVASATAAPKTTPTGKLFDVVTDAKYTNLNLNFSDSNKNYYLELDALNKNKNPAINGTAGDEETNEPAAFTEVQAVQAGGYLVYAPTGAEWKYTAEQQTNIVDKDGQNKVVAKGADIYSKNDTSGATNVLNVEANCAIDSSTFKPITEGLYIFRRNVVLADGTDTYEYSGYYFVPSASTATRFGEALNRDVYLALENDTNGNSNYTLPAALITETTTVPAGEVASVTVGDVNLYTAKETVITNSDLTWTYDSATPKLTATYPGADGKVGDDASTADANESLDDIAIDINLANIGTTGQTWTAKTADGKTTTFYYNDDVEAGDTTTKLVDSVKMADTTSQYAFLAFDFDLNVKLESVQVTVNEAGQETTEPITAKWATTDNIVAAGTAEVVKADELADIAWS